jgi:transposase
MVWVSDMLGSQRGHEVEWQVCLVHLLRDVSYAIECDETTFSAPIKRLFPRGHCDWARRQTLKDTTLKQHLADVDRRLNRVMAAIPLGEPGRKLHKRIVANWAHLFVFVTNRDAPYTNNVSERHLRPSVIIRCDQRIPLRAGVETYAASHSLVSTAKANHASALGMLRFVLAGQLPMETLAAVG